MARESYDNGGFFYICWGKFQIVRFTQGMLEYSFTKYPDGEYTFYGVGWGPNYFGFFKAGVRRPKK